MNKKDKRKFTADFKVKVALEALKGQSSIAEVAKKHELHPTGPPGGQILDWKKTLSERSATRPAILIACHRHQPQVHVPSKTLLIPRYFLTPVR